MSSLEKIKSEHGSAENFIRKAKEWISKIPKEYIKNHPHIDIFANKSVDWSDPKVLIIINRCFTSIEHVDWINSILRRIGKIENRLQRVKLNAQPRLGLNNSTKQKVTDSQEDFEKAKESALKFVQSVKEHVRENLDVTENQLEALNNIYERFDSTKNPLLKS